MDTAKPYTLTLSAEALRRLMAKAGVTSTPRHASGRDRTWKLHCRSILTIRQEAERTGTLERAQQMAAAYGLDLDGYDTATVDVGSVPRVDPPIQPDAEARFEWWLTSRTLSIPAGYVLTGIDAGGLANPQRVDLTDDEIDELVQDLITAAEAAKIYGVAPATFRAYVSRRQGPQPVTRIGDAPMFSRAQVTYAASRRRQGARSDLERS